MPLNSAIQKLKKSKIVESIIQFGSSLEKEDYNDIDLCIFTTRPLILGEQLRLVKDIPQKYDVSFYDGLPLHLKREVLKGKILFTRDYYKILKEVQRVDLEYPHYEHFLEEYHQEAMAAL